MGSEKGSYYHQYLEQLLALRKHYPYRMGLIQGFCSCGKITNEEYDKLQRQIVRKVKEPKLKDVGNA